MANTAIRKILATTGGRITQQIAANLFDFIDGNLVWKQRKLSDGRKSKTSGKIAGYKSHDGYMKVTLDGRAYYHHQIIFLIYNGYIPEIIDHIDGNTRNNNPENLRAATKSNNACNCKIHSNNTSGIKGLTWSKAAKKWQARVVNNGSVIYLGLFTTKEAAAVVLDAARKSLHGEFANNGIRKVA